MFSLLSLIDIFLLFLIIAESFPLLSLFFKFLLHSLLKYKLFFGSFFSLVISILICFFVFTLFIIISFISLVTFTTPFITENSILLLMIKCLFNLFFYFHNLFRNHFDLSKNGL